jgi:hypothetical protein
VPGAASHIALFGRDRYWREAISPGRDSVQDENKPSLAHLKWLIKSRNQNNLTAHKLLSLFEDHPAQIRSKPCSEASQILVAVSFSLWRAAFLSETTDIVHDRVDDAEDFLRKMLSDNTIGFSQDIQWREWAVNFYLASARFHLRAFEKRIKAGLGDLTVPATGFDASKSRWGQLHAAFEMAVNALEDELLARSKMLSKAAAKKATNKKR